MDARQFNEEVLFSQADIMRVSREDIQWLVEKARANRRKRVRLCAHAHAGASVHEMLIIHTDDVYVRPHKHLGKSESFHLIEGRASVVIFSEEGTVKETMRMGEFRSGEPFYYRIAPGIFHGLLIRSPYVVFHETTAGPFERTQTVYAPWAPGEDDVPSVTRFLEELKRRNA